jgi:hypothetical protein
MSDLMVIENKPLTAAEIRANVNLIQEVMKAVMKKDIHYGTIPGTQKPTLYKAGSEKILSTFRIAVELDVEDLSVQDCFRYRVKARGVIPSGEIVGCGIGECSTDEEKYKWRGAVCPEEFEATPEDRKRQKWIKGWNDKPAKTIPQIRTNPADLANTVLKMAKKRAQIDLTLTATGASDVFDQDIEDLPEEYVDGMRQEQKGKPPVTPPQSKSGKEEAKPQEGSINENQKRLLFVKFKKTGITEEAFLKYFDIKHVTDLPFALMNDAVKALDTGTIPAIEGKDEALPEKCAECGELNGHSASCPLAEPPNE